jgi:hypothetical protein
MNTWEVVFTQSRVNDGYYDEAILPELPWQWPMKTWFRTRLERVRDQDPTAFLRSLRKRDAEESVKTH